MTEYLHPRKLRRRFGLTQHEGEWLSPEEIAAVAMPHAPVCGVYFLISGREVQYIGQARDVDVRLSQHWKDGKRWERVTVIECDLKHLDLVESAYIHRFQPPLNGRQRGTGRIVAPLKEAQLYQQSRAMPNTTPLPSTHS